MNDGPLSILLHQLSLILPLFHIFRAIVDFFHICHGAIFGGWLLLLSFICKMMGKIEKSQTPSLKKIISLHRKKQLVKRTNT